MPVDSNDTTNQNQPISPTVGSTPPVQEVPNQNFEQGQVAQAPPQVETTQTPYIADNQQMPQSPSSVAPSWTSEPVGEVPVPNQTQTMQEVVPTSLPQESAVVETVAPQTTQVLNAFGQQGTVGPTQEVVAPPRQVVVEGSSDQGEVPPPKRSIKKFIFVALALMLVAVLAFVAYRMFFLKSSQSESVTLTWWGLWEDESIFAPLIASYQEANPGVTINYVRQSQTDYRERLTNSLAKGEGPDIFRFHNTWVPMFRAELDNVPPSFMSASDYAQTYYPVAVSDLTNGSDFVGVPIGYDALTLYINEGLFVAEGVTPPTTWDDLRELAKRFTKTENGEIVQAGVALGRTENVDHWQEILALMMLQNGADLTTPTGVLAEDALRFYTLFTNVDKVWDETLPTSTHFFASGNLAMYFGPSWRYFEIKQLNPELNFRTVPLPQLPKQTGLEADTAYATYWAEGVWARSANSAAAWNFLKYVSEKQNLETFYKNAAATRGFGEVYPRIDQKELLVDHPVLGAIAAQAMDAQSWYLVSRTFDGPTGINTLISSYFEDAVNAVNQGTTATQALETAALGVAQVLTQYGLLR